MTSALPAAPWGYVSVLLAISSTQQTWMVVAAVVAGLVVLGRLQERRSKFRTNIRSKKGAITSGFEMVAGCPEAVEDLKEVVAFLRDPERFSRLGARPPRGALLVGPPGTGKTLLARAVAEEAGVPFLAASATDFVEMYVGVGAKRVRELYASARSHGTAIVFIDEIDAVARARSMNDKENGTPGGPIEHENTLIALLTELDGFERSNVFTIAATNRADVLDAALTRPGRLERRIEVPLPDRTGRERILRLHASDKPLASDVDLTTIAARTAGFSGADLARVCNEAALSAVRRGLAHLEQACFTDAVELLALGRPRSSYALSDTDRRITAWHESGHALCGYLQSDAPDPVAVSVVPRGPAAGVTWFASDDRVFLTKEAAFAQLVVALGGRVAEEMLMGGSCTQGAVGDLQQATALATKMVAQYGMRSSLVARTPSTLRGMDEYTTNEVNELLNAAHDAARTVLRAHADALEMMAERLCVVERIDADEVARIVANTAGTTPPPPLQASPVLAPKPAAVYIPHRPRARVSVAAILPKIRFRRRRRA